MKNGLFKLLIALAAAVLFITGIFTFSLYHEEKVGIDAVLTALSMAFALIVAWWGIKTFPQSWRRRKQRLAEKKAKKIAKQQDSKDQ